MIKHTKAFALIETGLAIIAIAGFGLSVHQEEINKQQVNDAIALLQPNKQAISDYYLKNGVLPTNNTQASITNNQLDSKFENPLISKLNINEFGELIVTFNGNKFSDKTLILEPRIVDGKVTWDCNNGSLDNKYRPNDCINHDLNKNNGKIDKLIDFVDSGNLI